MPDFKDMLKFYRKRAGLSQRELAKQLGLAYSTISMYEVGKREPNFETEELIADFFNVDLNNLRGKDTEDIPVFEPEHIELIELYSKLNDSQKQTVLNLLRSFVYSDQE